MAISKLNRNRELGQWGLSEMMEQERNEFVHAAHAGGYLPQSIQILMLELALSVPLEETAGMVEEFRGIDLLSVFLLTFEMRQLLSVHVK